MESPGRLFLLAVAWLVAGWLAGLLGEALPAMIVHVHNGPAEMAHLLGAPPPVEPARNWRESSVLGGICGTIATQLLLLWAVICRARAVGQGDAVAGLGGTNLRRPLLLAGLAACDMVCTAGGIFILLGWLNVRPPESMSAFTDGLLGSGAMMQSAAVVIAVILAPLCEALFFRGWLWTGLRRYWRPGPVMLATGLPWLSIHMTDGVTRPLFLIPSAVILGLGRHYCGGVRGSLILHVFQNSLATVLLALAARNEW